MLTIRQTLIFGSCLVVVIIAAACGGGPAAPSKSDGTTIAGIVSVKGSAAAATAPAAAVTAPGAAATLGAEATGLTVSVVGTNLSSAVDSSGYFQLSGVPSGTVRLQFTDTNVNATVELSNVGQQQLIEIQVQLTGTAAAIVDEARSNSKVSLCHNTGTGTYHMIDVSQSAEPAHRAHGDGKVGDTVPGSQNMVFDQNCRVVGPAIKIEKSTNGEDADSAPGPTITVGEPVTWQYVVTNTGKIALTIVAVVDDRIGPLACPGTTLAVQQSMTCTASGVAVAGQYSNVGTVTANSASGAVTDSDASHYFGQVPGTEEGPKIQICHRTGNGSYHLIDISVSAEPAHRAHGDAKVGEAVPGIPGKTFGAGCTVN